MSVWKKRYHIRVQINTHHHFLQQASGIMSFVASGTHNDLAFRTELEQNQLEQSVFCQTSSMEEKKITFHHKEAVNDFRILKVIYSAG